MLNIMLKFQAMVFAHIRGHQSIKNCIFSKFHGSLSLNVNERQIIKSARLKFKGTVSLHVNEHQIIKKLYFAKISWSAFTQCK